MYSEEEKDSMWLFDVLEGIGVKDEYRRTWKQTCITNEILLSIGSLIISNNYGNSPESTGRQSQNDGGEETYQKENTICKFPDIFENIRTLYIMGSTFEATVTPDVPHDTDSMECHEWLPVIENISKAEKNKFSLLIVREPETPAGYVKLQLVLKDKPLTTSDWPFVKDMFQNLSHCFKKDKWERLVICDFFRVEEGGHMVSRLENQPAFSQKNYYGFDYDAVISYRGKTWPSMANDWLTRSRLNGWPTKDMIQDLKSLGFFVVRKGHPFSSEINLEFRISLTLQERKLMYNLTIVQHTCYVFLKIINRDIINLKCITSYHWKTCLFYMIEQNREDIWEKRLLFHCVKLCMKLMLKWVKNGVCPNYFIPDENLFDGRLTDSLKNTSEKRIVELLEIGVRCLLLVKSNNLCDYFKSRQSINHLKRLQEESENAYVKALYFAKTTTSRTVHTIFQQSILSYYRARCEQSSDKHSKFIKFLWLSKDRIQNISTIFEHTAHEVESAKALLLPCINMFLASTLSAFAFNMTQVDTRDILLFGSLSYLFINGDLSGRLKLISILLAAGLYADCEWHLDQLDEEDVKCVTSFCVCRYRPDDVYFLPQKYINTFKVSTCLLFLPIELVIIPDAMKYEMFRFVGTIHESDDRYWHYRAVVDCNIYFILLKYLLKKKLKKVKEYNETEDDIINLLHEKKVRHCDVAFNLLASICFSEFNTPVGLKYLTFSWTEMIFSDLCFGINDKEMKRKQYQYNAAKIHALVMLYKTWFARIPSHIYFCFQCFCKSETRLQQCSRCKVSTYCNKQCQRKNWKIHKKTCKMARKHHILFSTSVIPFAFQK